MRRADLDRADRDALGPAATLHLRDTGYRHLVAACEDLLDPVPYDRWPRHHQHFGASFAVTSHAYTRAGGVPPIPALEDVALYRALVAVDARVRHSPDVRVVTSGRRSSRVPIGLATQLAEWTQMREEGQPWLVESAASVERRLRARHRLRVAWRHAQSGRRLCETDRDGLAGELGAALGWLDDALERRGPFGALPQAVEAYHHAWGRPWEYGAPVDIADAVRDLRAALPRLASMAPGRLDAREEIEPEAAYSK